MSEEAEFSRWVVADEIGDEMRTMNIEATPEELIALTARFELTGLERLEASLQIKRAEKTGLIEIDGRFSAIGSQQCVVSLEPVAFELDETLSCFFADDGVEETDIELDLSDEDPPEIVENNQIDLGELTVQQLAVALDPYPRAPGVDIPASGLNFGEKDDKGDKVPENHPFAALRRLKR
ncbi:MAG TPA: DUF177 domain-containing protein [Rhodospirillaceae bacterium]|nr:hypothetical protein [Rhodospirillaceae bacterium]HAA91304.1 DUF177 domain-containing protein [Rhodospirillaceae bacterium]HAT35767.1 DUF177 domain-containing protein [Rhodospirillaceae bacterium]|tara:strand:- start:54 stop:593 length:540 start_codon:yes stop_codon:yes gene_type:complete